MNNSRALEEQEDIHVLYRQLDQSELMSVARQTILSIDDIRQEALLICWTICTGASDFNPQQGSLRQYVMGRLWSLRKRYAPGRSLDQEPIADPGLVALRWISTHTSGIEDESEAKDPLECLLTAETEAVQKGQQETHIQGLVSRLPPAERTWARLILSGASHDSIADLSGMTRRGGRYRFQRLIKQITSVTTECKQHD